MASTGGIPCEERIDNLSLFVALEALLLDLDVTFGLCSPGPYIASSFGLLQSDYFLSEQSHCSIYRPGPDKVNAAHNNGWDFPSLLGLLSTSPPLPETSVNWPRNP